MDKNQGILTDRTENENRKIDDYEGFLQAINNYFNTTTIANMPLFITDLGGIILQYGSNWDDTFKITTNIGITIYKIDRLD